MPTNSRVKIKQTIKSINNQLVAQRSLTRLGDLEITDTMGHVTGRHHAHRTLAVAFLIIKKQISAKRL